MHMPHILLMGHLGCFYLLAIMDTAVIKNWCASFYMNMFSFLRYIGVEFLGHMEILPNWQLSSIAQNALETYCS